MKNFRSNYKKFRSRGSNDRNFKRNGAVQKFNDNFSDINDFRRKKFSRNGNSNKLIEKYTELAKEALSNGDKILSENYFQHADHFFRVSDEKKTYKEDKKSNVKTEDLNSTQDVIQEKKTEQVKF
tara:strand:+ start:1406 stop:1780 length:375 start_codon:yes stop_codon:yes gene_type:complete